MKTKNLSIKVEWTPNEPFSVCAMLTMLNQWAKLSRQGICVADVKDLIQFGAGKSEANSLRSNFARRRLEFAEAVSAIDIVPNDGKVSIFMFLPNADRSLVTSIFRVLTSAEKTPSASVAKMTLREPSQPRSTKSYVDLSKYDIKTVITISGGTVLDSVEVSNIWGE